MCIMIPTFLVFFLSDALISINVKKELHQTMLGTKEQAVEYVSNALDLKFDELANSVYAFVYSDSCIEYLERSAAVGGQPAHALEDAERSLFLSFFKLIEQHDIISSCGIMTASGNYCLRNPYYYAFTEDMLQMLSDWEPTGLGGEVVVIPYEEKQLMFFMCPLPSRFGGGFFAGLINNSTISECITNLAGHEDTFYLLDETGTIFYSNDVSPEQALQPQAGDTLPASGYLTIGDAAYLSQKLETLPIFVLIKVLSDYPHATIEKLYFNNLIFQLVWLTIAVLVLMTFFRTFTRRLETMTATMSRLEIDRPDVKFDSTSRDELGLLGHHLNLMVERIKHQIDELAWKQEQIRVSQLQALQNQINPHFLYNALEHTRMVALANHDREAAKMIQIMAQILRYNVSNDLAEVPVREECFQAKRYLTLQTALLQDRLTVETEIDEAVYQYNIIKFVLQPLIENSLRHGIEPKATPSHLKLCITIGKEQLHVMVQDNGVGIPQPRLRELQQLLQLRVGPSGAPHVGLKNVNDRLVLFYGETAGLHLDSGEGVGTTVKFSIPLQRLSRN